MNSKFHRFDIHDIKITRTKIDRGCHNLKIWAAIIIFNKMINVISEDCLIDKYFANATIWIPVHETKDLISGYFQLWKKIAMFTKKLKNISVLLKHSLIKIEYITSVNGSEKIHIENEKWTYSRHAGITPRKVIEYINLF